MLTKQWKLELTLATDFGSHAQMVNKFGGQILATKFGFVPDCWYDVTPTKMWLSTSILAMTLTLDFQGQILRKLYLWNF